MRTLGQLGQAAQQAAAKPAIREIPGFPTMLPLYAGLSAIPPGYQPSVPNTLVFNMWNTLQELARSLNQYSNRNPEYIPNVNTWRTQAALLMNRTISGSWTAAQVTENYQSLVANAKQILGTAESWTEYVGSALQERLSGIYNSLKSASVAVVSEAAKGAAFIIQKGAEAAGGGIEAFWKKAGTPIIVLGLLGIAGLYAWSKGH